jgi:glycosyltransferase involved in cell wall biosynthesis
VKVDVVDPSSFTPPYDHALCAALARAGLDVRLVSSRFAYGEAPVPDGYRLDEHFYRRARGPAGSGRRRAMKLLEHVPDMLRYRTEARRADVVHFQWIDVQWLDGPLLPRRPLVLTAHDLLPREPRPGQAGAQRRLYDRAGAVITHSAYGRSQLVGSLGVAPEKVHVVPHGVFEHLTHLADELPLPTVLQQVTEPVVLFFGLLRPYKGLEVLLEAWRGITDAELWIVGRPRIPLEPLQARADRGVRFVPRFVPDAEVPAFFRRADLVVLPYAGTERIDQSGVLATALAFGKPSVVSDVGGFGEVAATGAAVAVPPDDPAALRAALARLLGEPAARSKMARAAVAAAKGPYSWEHAAHETLRIYQQLV